MLVPTRAGSPAPLRVALPAALYAHPEEVLEDGALSLGEKREILAAWGSDANAVPDRPWLRQIGGRYQVPVREIVEALKALDRLEVRRRRNPSAAPVGVP